MSPHVSGRPRKRSDAKSRIVPVSTEPALLEQVDQYAKTTGISRSRLAAEGLRLRKRADGECRSEPAATDLTAAIMETLAMETLATGNVGNMDADVAWR